MQFRSTTFASTFSIIIISARLVASVPTIHEGMKPDVMNFSTLLHSAEVGFKGSPVDLPDVMPGEETVDVSMDNVPDCNVLEPTALPECVNPDHVDAGACSLWEYYAIGHCLELECSTLPEKCMMEFERRLGEEPVADLASCYESKVSAWCKEASMPPADADTQLQAGDMVEDWPMRPEAVVNDPTSTPESMDLDLEMITGEFGGEGLIPEVPAIL